MAGAGSAAGGSSPAERLFAASLAADAATVSFAEALSLLLAALRRRGAGAHPIVPSAARVFRTLAERERIRLRRMRLLTAMAYDHSWRRPAAESALLARRLAAAASRAAGAIRASAPPVLAAAALDELVRTFAAIQALPGGPRRKPPSPPWLADPSLRPKTTHPPAAAAATATARNARQRRRAKRR